MARHERQRQHQLVFDDRLRVERRRCDQHFRFTLRVEPCGFRFVMREQELGALNDRPFDRPQATLAFESYRSVQLDRQRRAPQRIGAAFDSPLDRRMLIDDTIRQSRKCRGIHRSAERFALACEPIGVESRERFQGQAPKRRIIAYRTTAVKEMSGKTRRNARSLVLASGSSYRKALLERLELEFEVVPADIDETPTTGESPGATALRLAEAKARTVAEKRPGSLVIGSDQVANLDGKHVGKPGGHAAAVMQLKALSGRTVTFHTGVALCDAESLRCRSVLVDVISTFRTLSDAEIESYLDRERPYDCAGAVKSERLGIALFERISSGDPTALIGLPLIALIGLLRDEGVDVLSKK